MGIDPEAFAGFAVSTLRRWVWLGDAPYWTMRWWRDEQRARFGTAVLNELWPATPREDWDWDKGAPMKSAA